MSGILVKVIVLSLLPLLITVVICVMLSYDIDLMIMQGRSESGVEPLLNHPRVTRVKNPREAGTFSLVCSLMYSVCPCSSISSDQPRGGEPYWLSDWLE